MKHREESDETRADIARRRLAQIAASFDAELPAAQEDRPPRRPRIEIPHARALVTVAVAASVLLVWWLLSSRPQTSDPAAPLAFTPSDLAQTAVARTNTSATDLPGTDTAEAPATELIIDVAGKVKRPGIVTLPAGSRVFEAIEAAGGVKGRIDTSAINLARELTDGEQVLVGVEPVADPGLGGNASAPAAAKIDLNTATAEQLDELPGVGPVTAQAILTWRETNGRFASIEDLLDVKGIGEATFAELRDLVVV